MADKEDSEKGFKITDRRRFAGGETGGTEEPSPKEGSRSVESEPSEKKEEPSSSLPPMEASFSSLILSLSTSALFQLGILEDPETKQSHRDLSLAEQTINLIGLLEKKTQGNLTPDEKQLVESVLYDLRMKFIEETRRKS